VLMAGRCAKNGYRHVCAALRLSQSHFSLHVGHELDAPADGLARAGQAQVKPARDRGQLVGHLEPHCQQLRPGLSGPAHPSQELSDSAYIAADSTHYVIGTDQLPGRVKRLWFTS
jgi:hypothetical protein